MMLNSKEAIFKADGRYTFFIPIDEGFKVILMTLFFTTVALHSLQPILDVCDIYRVFSLSLIITMITLGFMPLRERKIKRGT